MLDSSKLSPAACTSIHGYMTAWLPASSGRRLSESDIYAAIENYIAKSYNSDSIVGVTYIPSASEDTVTNDPVISTLTKTSDFRESTDNNESSWDLLPGVGLLACIVSLLTLVGLVRIVQKSRNSTDDACASPSVTAIEPEISEEMGSQPATPKNHACRSGTLSDTDDCSVATEDYTQENYTQDEFIQRLPTYGSTWGDRVRTWTSYLGGETVVPREEEEMSLPSEMGEEVGPDGLL
jgi:hypothetical protein